MLFQQNTQRIEVIVRRAGGDGGTEQPQGAKTTDDASQSGEQTANTGGKKGTSSRFSKNAIMHYANVVKQMGMKAARYYLSGIKYNTGDEALQDMVDRTVDIVTDYSNLAIQTAFGAYYGARFGGAVGGIIGGAVSLTSGAVGITFNRLSEQRNYNMKIFKEENGIAYRRSRADINFTNGRLR